MSRTKKNQKHEEKNANFRKHVPQNTWFVPCFKNASLCYQTRGLPWAGRPRAASSVWVLDFMQERFSNTNPGGFNGTFIEAGESGIEAATDWVALAHWKVREKGVLDTGSGVSLGWAATAHCFLVASLVGTLRI